MLTAPEIFWDPFFSPKFCYNTLPTVNFPSWTLLQEAWTLDGILQSAFWVLSLALRVWSINHALEGWKWMKTHADVPHAFFIMTFFNEPCKHLWKIMFQKRVPRFTWPMSNPCDQIGPVITTPLRKEGFAEHYRKAFSTLGRVGFGPAKGCKKGANFTLDEGIFLFGCCMAQRRSLSGRSPFCQLQ